MVKDISLEKKGFAMIINNVEIHIATSQYVCAEEILPQ